MGTSTHRDQCPLCGDPTQPLAVRLRGTALLNNPRFNKGTAFSPEERDALGLEGLLPPHVATLEEQLSRVHRNFLSFEAPLERYIYLRALQDRNETLFYAALLAHLDEYMPIIYTPTVAEAVREFSHIFRTARGLYISPDNIDEMDAILANAPGDNVAIIVATDSESILGIGDQGVGGMGIPIGKLALYTALGGICPARGLPVCLDVGTNNEALLADPLYLGYRAPRLDDEAYYAFLDKFVAAVRRHHPQALVQWEDFSRERALAVLERYAETLPSFNDDIQGTAAVAYAATLGALRITGQRYCDQRFVIVGAGAAGTGIAQMTRQALQRAGLSEEEARRRLFVLDSKGLIVRDRPGLDSYKQPLACDPKMLAGWRLTGDRITLYEVIVNVQPTVLYGVSGQRGAITEQDVRAMAATCARPIIFPLSNPTANAEAEPAALLAWTEGRAIIATGSPFAPMRFAGREYRFAQANNVAIFPGVGLGAFIARASTVTPEFFFAAAEALHGLTEPSDYAQGLVLPPNRDLRETARAVAAAVATKAWEQGLAAAPPPDDILQYIEKTMYIPRYRPYVAG